MIKKKQLEFKVYYPQANIRAESEESKRQAVENYGRFKTLPKIYKRAKK
jgi:hypothetical protein